MTVTQVRVAETLVVVLGGGGGSGNIQFPLDDILPDPVEGAHVILVVAQGGDVGHGGVSVSGADRMPDGPGADLRAVDGAPDRPAVDAFPELLREPVVRADLRAVARPDLRAVVRAHAGPAPHRHTDGEALPNFSLPRDPRRSSRA